jgi:hypothetical protein
VFADGSLYEGLYEADKKHGAGVYYNKGRKSWEVQYYQHNKLLSKTPLSGEPPLDQSESFLSQAIGPYRHILNYCSTQKTPFEDPSFPHNLKSLYSLDEGVLLPERYSKWMNCTWKRMDDSAPFFTVRSHSNRLRH